MPNICGARDLLHLCEVFDGEDGRLLRTTFSYVDEDDVTWFGKADETSKFDLSLEDFDKLLEKVPDETVYPNVTSSITILKTDREDYFIKRPNLACLDHEEETKLLPQVLLEEAEVLEQISKTPHPNLVYYYGCTVKDGRITGIALEKHRVMLQYRYEEQPRELDIEAVMKGLRAGITHLHSLGFAHNDLNPTNIALDKADNAVILDFGSCKKFGEQLISAGTPGWTDEEPDCYTSSRRNDEIGIQKLEAWLEEQKTKRSNSVSGQSGC